MALTYHVVLSSTGPLAAGGVLLAREPLVQGQTVEHHAQTWQVARIDDHQQPPLVALRRLEAASPLRPRRAH